MSLAGTCNTNGAGGVTVNVALVVIGAWHELESLNVTVTLPPHADGAPVLLLLKDALQPPFGTPGANEISSKPKSFPLRIIS